MLKVFRIQATIRIEGSEMARKPKSARNQGSAENAANDLVTLARLRYPTVIRAQTIGQIVDRNIPWDDPDPGVLNLVWDPRSVATLDRLVRHLSASLTEESRQKFSDSTLRQKTQRLAGQLGSDLLEHRDSKRLNSDATIRWNALVKELESNDERWDIVLPISNLRLATSRRAIRIGPVLIVRDPLAQYLWRGTNESDLAEFGRWAVRKHVQSGGALRATFDTIYSYAKVEDVPGEDSLAVQRAARDVRTALMILRLVYFKHGSFSERERFGSSGDFFDPVERFDLTGSLADDVRITLSARSISDPNIAEEPREPRRRGHRQFLDSLNSERGPDEFSFRIDRIGMSTPVDVIEETLLKRWPLIETLADIVWTKEAGWSVAATAMRWFAEGIEAGAREDAFIKFATAIDVLLGREERGYSDSLTNRIAERTGFLLGENDPDRRRAIAKLMKDIFDARGRIIHGERTTTDEELWRMESIARLIILRMVWEIRNRGHQDVKAFIDWVARLKFGQPFTTIPVPRFLQLSEAWLDTSS